MFCAGCLNRTDDLMLTKQLLYLAELSQQKFNFNRVLKNRNLVGRVRLELTTPCSQSKCATNCATVRCLSYFNSFDLYHASGRGIGRSPIRTAVRYRALTACLAYTCDQRYRPQSEARLCGRQAQHLRIERLRQLEMQDALAPRTAVARHPHQAFDEPPRCAR